MQFSYELNEADYLAAYKVPIGRPTGRWSRVLTYIYKIAFFSSVWFSFALGMLLEWSDVTAGRFALSPVLHIAVSSVVPSVILAWPISLALRVVLRWPALKRKQELFRLDPGCRAETTVDIRLESATFHSATSSSKSDWACYDNWAERNGILVLRTRSGSRKILKVADLSETQKAELRSILSAALPKK